jgi:hypothetical protein
MRYISMRCTPMRCNACEMHVYEVHAYEMHAHEMCAHEMTPIRYTPMRHTPVTCMHETHASQSHMTSFRRRLPTRYQRTPQSARHLSSDSDASHSFSNNIFAAFISHPYFVHLPSWNIYTCSDAKRLLGWVLILRIHDGKRSSTDEMSCHTIVGMWRVMRFSDPTCQILLFCYRAVPFMARLTLHQST